MTIKISLGFKVEINNDGRFCLPDRAYSCSELKKVAREVNRALMSYKAHEEIEEND